MTDPPETQQHWLGPGVAGIGTASFLADVGHEIPTALLPNLLTATLGAPAAALGLIEGVSDGLAGITRLAGGAIADDPHRRRAQAVAGYTATAILSSLIGAATTVWQVGILRAGAWAARGLRVPARNALLADIVPANVYGRAYGFERAMDNLGAGRVLARLGPRLLGAAGLVVGGIGMGVAAAADGPAALAAGVGVAAAGTGAVFVVASATALGQVGPDEAGLASGIVSTFHEFGASLGAAVVSSIAAASLAGTSAAGVSRGFATTAAVAAVAALLTLVIAPGRQAASSPAGAAP